MRIYIESTIPSLLVARPARTIKEAARQQITKDWWEFRRHEHELYISQIVFEISSGEAAMAELRIEAIAALPLLNISPEATNLAESIVTRGILPDKARRDSTHIAIATVEKMDILLTWNCRHLANGSIKERLRRFVSESGGELPTICTPEELMSYGEDKNPDI